MSEYKKMSNVNDWAFARQMESFKLKILDPQTKKVNEAQAIMDNRQYPWAGKEQYEAAEAKLKSYKQLLAFHLELYKKAMTLINQHENLVNNLSKWYDCWYDNISNDGKQETELMSSQADMLGEIFLAIYQELKPLNLNIKPPKM